MIETYVILIIKCRKKLSQVPESLRDAVITALAQRVSYGSLSQESYDIIISK